MVEQTRLEKTQGYLLGAKELCSTCGLSLTCWWAFRVWRRPSRWLVVAVCLWLQTPSLPRSAEVCSDRYPSTGTAKADCWCDEPLRSWLVCDVGLVTNTNSILLASHHNQGSLCKSVFLLFNLNTALLEAFNYSRHVFNTGRQKNLTHAKNF